MAKKKKISPDMQAFMRELIRESLRDWFKKEKWVRISSSGNIAGPCGTSKNKKNPDRCLPKAKAQSLTKGQRAATAAKKKKAGAKGKTVVKNTKKATVKKEGLWANINAKKKAGKKSSHGNSNAYKDAKKAGKALKGETKGAPKGHYFTKSGNLVKGRLTKDAQERGARLSDPKDKQRSKIPPVTQYSETANPQDGKAAPYGSGYKKVTKEDITNLVVGMIHELKNEDILSEKDDRCTRIAKRKYDTWPSAYASGAVVRCRRGDIWKGVKEETIDEMNCEHGKYYCNHDKKFKCRKGPKKSR